MITNSILDGKCPIADIELFGEWIQNQIEN